MHWRLFTWERCCMACLHNNLNAVSSSSMESIGLFMAIFYICCARLFPFCRIYDYYYLLCVLCTLCVPLYHSIPINKRFHQVFVYTKSIAHFLSIHSQAHPNTHKQINHVEILFDSPTKKGTHSLEAELQSKRGCPHHGASSSCKHRFSHWNNVKCALPSPKTSNNWQWTRESENYYAIVSKVSNASKYKM